MAPFRTRNPWARRDRIIRSRRSALSLLSTVMLPRAQIAPAAPFVKPGSAPTSWVWTYQLLRVLVAELFRRLLEQQSSQLHRFQVHVAVRPNAGR